MRHVIVVSSCLLLALFSLGVDASGGGRLPVPIKRPCVGTCCQTRGSINRARFCSTQLALFAGGDTVAAATITSSLVSSLETVTFEVGSKRNSTACIWRDRLSQIGADFTSLKYFFQDEEVVTVGNKDFPMSGSGAVFTAGTAVYLVFSGVDSPNKYTKRVRDIEVDGKTVQVMAQFYNYYQLYTDDTDSIIEEAIDQYKALPDKSSGKRLFIIGHSAGGSVALYAALDLADAGYVADEVYVFGASKPGYKNFVDAYLDTELGDKTTVWWNELDVEPVLPTKNARQTTQIKNNQPKDDDQEVVSWGSDPKYARLPGSNYWRIAPPSNIKDTAPGTCVKVESDSDVWYDPCPAEDADPNNFKCGLTWLDHPSDIYHKNIKACALEDYNKGHKVPTRGEFNPTCITDLVV